MMYCNSLYFSRNVMCKKDNMALPGISETEKAPAFIDSHGKMV